MSLILSVVSRERSGFSRPSPKKD